MMDAEFSTFLPKRCQHRSGGAKNFCSQEFKETVQENWKLSEFKFQNVLHDTGIHG